MKTRSSIEDTAPIAVKFAVHAHSSIDFVASEWVSVVHSAMNVQTEGRGGATSTARLRRRPDAFEITLGCVLYALGVKNSGAYRQRQVLIEVPTMVSRRRERNRGAVLVA